MSVQFEVGKPLGNNRVEVNATYDGISRRKFSVPEDKADEFVSTYKSKYNKASIFSTLGMCILGGLGGVAGGQLAKNASNSWVRWGAVIAGGLVGYVTSMFLAAKPIANLDKSITTRYGAEEIKPSKTS